MVAIGLHLTSLVTLTDREGSPIPVVPAKLTNSHVPSLGHMFILKPVTETQLALLQVQSQPLELEGGTNFM